MTVARMGVTMNYETRDIYGKDETSMQQHRKNFRWGVSGNTGGEGGHDTYGWVANTGDDIDDPNLNVAEGS